MLRCVCVCACLSVLSGVELCAAISTVNVRQRSLLKPECNNEGFRAQVKGDIAIASNPFKVSTQKAGQDILLLHPGESEEIPGIPDVAGARQDDVAFDSV